MFSNSQTRYITQLEEQYKNPLCPTSAPPHNYNINTYPQIEIPRTMSTSVSAPMLPTLGTDTHGATQVQMEHMMSSNSGTYQGLIQDFGHFRQVNDQYLKIHNRPRGDCSDFPPDSHSQQQLVKLLFEAAHDCSQTYEPEGSQSVRRLRQGNYADLEFELALWPLLMSTRDAQIGQCRLPNYLYCKEPPYNSYGSFMERFEAVCDALRLSKDVVISLFKDATFKHRLAWRPRTELNQKATNRKLNGERDVQNAIGIRVAQENGIKATKSGELVDRNGQIYGNVKKRSTAFENKISNTKRRGRDLKRGKTPGHLDAQKDRRKRDSQADNDTAEKIETGESTLQLDPSYNGYTGYTEDLSQGHQEVPAGYAPNNMNTLLMQPTLSPTEDLYSQDPNPLAGPDVSLPSSLQGNTNASSAYTPYGWHADPTPTAGNLDMSLDFTLDMGLPQAETMKPDGLSQIRDTANLYNFNPTAPTSFGGQLSNVIAQGQPDPLEFVNQADPSTQNQFYTPGPPGYHMQY